MRLWRFLVQTFTWWLWLALIGLVLFAITGCGEDARAKNAADARSGLHAAAKLAPEVAPILSGVDHRLPAIAGVNSADWPAPEWPPERVASDPSGYDQSAPPEPPRGLGFWAAVGGTGLAALAALRAIAPLIPGGGPLVKLVADGVWAIAAHSDQKAADKAQATVVMAVDAARPVLSALRSLPADQMPPAIAQAIASPVIAAALDHLSRNHA